MTEPRIVVPNFKEPKKPKKATRRKKGPKTLLMEDCDAMFGAIVRSAGRCRLADGKCSSVLQCAHGFSRRYRATRWDERNAWCLCASHHKKYTEDPIGWDDWLRAEWGEALYSEMRALAHGGRNPDMHSVALILLDRCDALGLDVKRRVA